MLSTLPCERQNVKNSSDFYSTLNKLWLCFSFRNNLLPVIWVSLHRNILHLKCQQHLALTIDKSVMSKVDWSDWCFLAPGTKKGTAGLQEYYQDVLLTYCHLLRESVKTTVLQCTELLNAILQNSSHQVYSIWKKQI